MNYDDKALKTISEEVIKAVEKYVAIASFDKTIEGRITAPLGNGRYRVNINGYEYDTSVHGNSIFHSNDIVRVVIPQNNYNNMYILPVGSVHVVTVENNVMTTSSDKVIEGQIITPLDNGEYKVSVDGVEYDTYVYGDSIFQTDDVVKVKVPQNDYQGMYIIPTGDVTADDYTGGGIPADEVQANLDLHTGDTTVHTTQAEKDNWNEKLPPTGSGSDLTNAFTESEIRINLTTGEKLSASLGKIKKWFTDLKTVAFTGSYNDLEDKPIIPDVEDFNIMGSVLNGFSVIKGALVGATDTVISAFGKLQGQITDHVVDTVKHITSTERTNWNSAHTNSHAHSNKTILDATTASFLSAEKTKLSEIADNANNYTHPTSAGSKHIPTGGSAGQILRYSASGTAAWGAENNTVTTINGKTGAITKDDITALGIPALASPAFTGNPTVPTQAAGNNSTRIATTAFVQNSMSDAGLGNMLKAVYDTNNNGIVDDSEAIGGKPADDVVFLSHEDSQTISDLPVIDTLKNKLGVIIYPKTVTSAVYDKETGERLDNMLVSSSGSSVVLSSTQPSNQRAGDLWYQII